MRQGWCGRAARNCGTLFPAGPPVRKLVLFGGQKFVCGCFSPRASLRKKLRCFKSVEQSSLLRHLEASMAYGRCCSKLLLGLCGRFLVRPGTSQGLHQNSNCVCVWAQAVCVHVRVRISCVDVGVNMYVCICACAYACAHACISIWFKNVQHLSV